MLGVEPPQEFIGERDEVALALAQRRQEDRHDADAVVEIGAKLAALDRVLKVLVGRADEAHVDLDRPHAADPFEFAFLQNAQQLDLEARRNVADLVEKQRAAVGEFEPALAQRLGAREGAAFMTE